MLTIDPSKVCYIIIKAREFDAQVEPEMEPGSDEPDEDYTAILESFADNPTYDELLAALQSLNEDELDEVLALMWLGRGDFSKDEWKDAVAAAQLRDLHGHEAPDYLIRTPLLGDYLDEGLTEMGYTCEEFERAHL